MMHASFYRPIESDCYDWTVKSLTRLLHLGTTHTTLTGETALEILLIPAAGQASRDTRENELNLWHSEVSP